MQLLTVITAAAGLLASASASPASKGKQNDNYKFHVQNWSAGCARAGCYYNFNVTGRRSGDKPAFKAYCSGSDVGYFESCEVLKGPVGIDVAAELAPYDVATANGIAAMGVSLRFTPNLEDEYPVTYNYTGHYNATFNQFVAPTYNFKVKPDEVTAVA